MCTFIVAVMTTATLLIGYYHDILLRNIDADLLIDKMCSIGLLTACECNIISSRYCNYQRNWVLLECVRNMDVHALTAFCAFVQEIWPQVGSQLITGVYTYVL